MRKHSKMLFLKVYWYETMHEIIYSLKNLLYKIFHIFNISLRFTLTLYFEKSIKLQDYVSTLWAEGEVCIKIIFSMLVLFNENAVGTIRLLKGPLT